MIKQLEFINFGGHTARYTFGPKKNLIKGKNEAGKSSIAKAIAFNMMGVDTEGSKNPDHLISVGSDSTEVSLTTAKATIKRTKKRGGVSNIKLLREGIPAISMNQTELMGQINLSLDVFMSSWLAGYFMKLKADARLKVLGEIANLNRKELLLSLLPEGYQVPAQVKLINPKIDADAVAGIRRQEQNKKAAADATLSTLVANQNNSRGMTEQEYNDKLSLLAEVTSTIELHDLYQRQAVAYGNEVEKRKENEKRAKELIGNVKDAQASLEILNKSLPGIEQALDFAQKQKNDLKQKASVIEGRRKKIEMAVPTKHGVEAGFCATCQQPVNETHVAAIKGAYDKLVNEYNAHSRSVADFNKILDQELHPLREGYKSADAEEVALTQRLYQEKADHKSTSDALNKLKDTFDKATRKRCKK